MSPDGQWVAFVVKQARIPTNDYESSLRIVATTATTDPRVLRKASSFSNVRRSTVSDALYYISDNDGPRQINKLKTREAAVEDLVLQHNADITRFEISPDGQKIAFVSHELSDRKNFESKGIVYDDTIHSATTLITDAWQPEGSVWRLWIHDLCAQTTEPLWQNSMAIDKLVWSPDSSTIAVVYAALAHPSEGGSAFNMDIGVISPATRVSKRSLLPRSTKQVQLGRQMAAALPML